MNIARQIHASTDFSQYLDEAKAVAQLTFEQLGVPHLIDSTTFELNNRFVGRAADASVSFRSGERVGTIRIGTKYLAVAPQECRIQTFVHEAVHIADAHFNPWTWNKGNGHNATWFNLMRHAGYPNARPTCSVNLNDFKTFYRHYCPCGKIITISSNLFGRIRNQTRFYSCPKCGNYVSISNIRKVAQ